MTGSVFPLFPSTSLVISGAAAITSRAIEKSGKPIPTRVITISLDGKIL
ncbi:MAG: hypothetical protein IKC77_01325 [Lentisphaeria bacterium]|nr:hypothetical protein [Lentisphaeria bacterium]